MTEELQTQFRGLVSEAPTSRLDHVVDGLGIPRSTWYYKPTKTDDDKRRRRRPPYTPAVEQAVVGMATTNPWYGYKRIAVMCRRAGSAVTYRQAYRVMKNHGLLQPKRRVRQAELYQAAKLYELLPSGPNDLWQMDVTYIHIPGFGWWYGVTVIDYYSRYLLALHLTHSYSSKEVLKALDMARNRAESIHGPLKKNPFLVTDNGSSFIARRFVNYVAADFAHVRIQYRTPTQLGLLERFHGTLKREEVYWRLYDNPEHARECLAEFHQRYNYDRPHWALTPEEGGDPLVPAEVYVEGRRTGLPRWQAWARDVKKKLDNLLHLEAA